MIPLDLLASITTVLEICFLFSWYLSKDDDGGEWD